MEEFGGWALFQQLLAALSQVAEKHGVDPASVAMRFVLDRPSVAAVIVGARNAAHVARHRAVLDLRLEAEDYAVIEAVADRRQGPRGDTYALEREKGGRHMALLRHDLNAQAHSERAGYGLAAIPRRCGRHLPPRGRGPGP